MPGICTCGLLKVQKYGTRNVDGHEVCNNCDRTVEATLLVAPPGSGGGGAATASGATGPRGNGAAAKAERADGIIAAAFWLGLGAGVIGFVVLVAAWPGQADNSSAETGNFVLAMLGLAVATVGQTAVFFAVIAWGVKLGTQAAVSGSG